MAAVDLVSKAKAPIWQHFGFKQNANKEPDVAICKLRLIMVAVSGGYTSNLHTHLQVHHKSVAAKIGPVAKSRPGEARQWSIIRKV